MNAYLTEKISSHIALILDSYIENPDDIGYAINEIMAAIERELIWGQIHDADNV